MVTEIESGPPEERARRFLRRKRILYEVACHFDIKVEDISSRRRYQTLIAPRYIAAYLLREMGYSYPRIGHYLDRDHSTIVYAVSRVHRYDQDLVAIMGKIRKWETQHNDGAAANVEQ